jgi:hypothetical protein
MSIIIIGHHINYEHNLYWILLPLDE